MARTRSTGPLATTPGARSDDRNLNRIWTAREGSKHGKSPSRERPRRRETGRRVVVVAHHGLSASARPLALAQAVGAARA